MKKEVYSCDLCSDVIPVSNNKTDNLGINLNIKIPMKYSELQPTNKVGIYQIEIIDLCDTCRNKLGDLAQEIKKNSLKK